MRKPWKGVELYAVVQRSPMRVTGAKNRARQTVAANIPIYLIDRQ
jgi:hypothetical protein